MLLWSLHIFLLLIRRFLSGWIITWVEVIKESSTTFFIVDMIKSTSSAFGRKKKVFYMVLLKTFWVPVKNLVFLYYCGRIAIICKNWSILVNVKTIRQIAPIFVAFSEKLKFTLCKYLNVHLWLNSHFSAHLILKDMILFNL